MAFAAARAGGRLWLPPRLAGGRSMALRRLASTSAPSSTAEEVAAPGGRRWRRWAVVGGVGALGIGGAARYYALHTYDQALYKTTPDMQRPANGLTTVLLRLLPTRALSRLWGRITWTELPVSMRAPVYMAWTRAFGCNLDEMAAANLDDFPSLGDFFVRALKAGVRPIAATDLVSPADGHVAHFGRIDSRSVEQVKGAVYDLGAFLGGNHLPEQPRPGYSFFHVVIYLAPGDYHRFHSPARWKTSEYIHFPGELLSVRPGVMQMVHGLFVFNERIVLKGTWQHGFFAMVAIGATNVGSIAINIPNQPLTNNPKDRLTGSGRAFSLNKENDKGDEIGAFRLGSCIVLVFEAPNDFQFNLESGQAIQYGQPLGNM